MTRPVRIACPFCQREVKLNEMIRSPYHVVGCVHCYSTPTAAMEAEAIAAKTGRPA